MVDWGASAMKVYATMPGGKYVPFAESLETDPLPPGAKRSVYVNLTNRCNCACTFCLRGLKDMGPERTLWFGAEGEPTVAEIADELRALPRERLAETVFCGFGEPTLRLDALLELLRICKDERPEVPTRLNTNGLAELEWGRPVAQDFAGLLDVVSISLNASTPARHFALTRAKFGERSWAAMLAFAESCKKHVPHVVLTVVDHVEDGAEIDACRALCKERGLTLRVRPWEGS